MIKFVLHTLNIVVAFLALFTLLHAEGVLNIVGTFIVGGYIGEGIYSNYKKIK